VSEPATVPALGTWGRALLGVLPRAVASGLEVRLRIEPGLVTARVQPSRGSAHRSKVRFMGLGSRAWDRVLATTAAEPALLGALLDGRLPEAVVEAAGGRVAIVPQRREVMVVCSCRTKADRCPFVRATWWGLAEAVDVAPATLLTLRGRTPEQLVATVRRRAAQRSRDEDDWVDAGAAFECAPRPLPTLPAVAAEEIGRRGLQWPSGDRAHLPDSLSLLVADAAARALDLTSGRGDGGLQLSEEADLARRAARLEHDPSLMLMADRAKTSMSTLKEMGRAWQSGGAALVDVIYGTWSPPAEPLGLARKLLAAHGRVTVWMNRACLDHGQLELRLGRDGLWYLVDVSGGGACLTYPPARDPAQLVAARLGFVPRMLERPKAAQACGEQLSLL
jgi:hypothetical protein